VHEQRCCVQFIHPGGEPEGRAAAARRPRLMDGSIRDQAAVWEPRSELERISGGGKSLCDLIAACGFAGSEKLLL